ncbi:MAG: hypothetical protein SOY04_04775 [Clostridium celatum]|nr:hypothetical protein [Clostridium celatum]
MRWNFKEVGGKVKEVKEVKEVKALKKYKPNSNKKVADGLENVFKRGFTATSINEKWVGDITYVHTLEVVCAI